MDAGGEMAIDEPRHMEPQSRRRPRLRRPGRPGRKVLAIASGGGHWVQLRRVLPAFEGAEMVYASVDDAYFHDLPGIHDLAGARCHVVTDATRWSRLSLVKLVFEVLWLLLRERPDVVFTTGALPGGLAVIFGRLLGMRTIWLDSIANVDEMSMTGMKVRRFASLWLTQWPHLAREGGPEYAGAVL